MSGFVNIPNRMNRPGVSLSSYLESAFC